MPVAAVTTKYWLFDTCGNVVLCYELKILAGCDITEVDGMSGLLVLIDSMKGLILLLQIIINHSCDVCYS